MARQLYKAQITQPDVSFFADFGIRVAGDNAYGSLAYTGLTKTAGCFYGGTDDPDGTTRVNLDAELYATKIYGAVWG